MASCFCCLTKCHGVPCSLPSRITTKVLKNCKTFSSRPRPKPRPNVQDQDQDFMIQDQAQDQDFHFCPRGASRPRPWSRGLPHWSIVTLAYLVKVSEVKTNNICKQSPTPVYLTPPLRGFPLEFYNGAWLRKLEWCPYQIVEENCGDIVHSFRHNNSIGETVRWTDLP